MLIETHVLDKNLWLKEFKKKFASYCGKLPFYVDYTIVSDSLLMFNIHFQDRHVETIEFNLKLQQPVQENISFIKNYLIKENYYPIIKLTETTYNRLSVDESRILINEKGVDPAIAVNTEVETVTNTYWRVEKIHEKENRISLRDLQDNKIYLYSMKVPVIKFMELLNTDVTMAGKFFWEKADLVNCLN
jgi:hypothetical protein